MAINGEEQNAKIFVVDVQFSQGGRLEAAKKVRLV